MTEKASRRAEGCRPGEHHFPLVDLFKTAPRLCLCREMVMGWWPPVVPGERPIQPGEWTMVVAKVDGRS